MHSLSSNAKAALVLFPSAARAKIKAQNAAAVLERNVRLDFGFVVVPASILLLCSSYFSSFSSSSVLLTFFAEAVVKRGVPFVVDVDFFPLFVQNDDVDFDDDEVSAVALPLDTEGAEDCNRCCCSCEETLPVPWQHLHGCAYAIVHVNMFRNGK